MKIYFCEKCGVSIPLQEVVGGRATARDGKTYCQGCIPGEHRDSEDLRLYFCDNCRVSIPLQDVITNRARVEGENMLCTDCARLGHGERTARKERIKVELKEKEESRYRLHFCDKCNTSIPQSHLVIGRAVIRSGRTYCERCKTRTERKGATVATTFGIVVLTVAVLAAGFFALGGPKLLANPEPATAGPSREEVLRTEIMAEVARSIADKERDMRARFDELDGVIDGLAAKSKLLADELTVIQGSAQSASAKESELRSDLNARLSRAESSLREALEKLSALESRLSELRAAPPPVEPAIAPRPGPRTPLEEDPPPAEPEPVPEAPLNVKAWLEQLSHSDAGVRFAAAVELGKSGWKPAAEPLARLLDKDKDTFVRRAAARSLGELDAWEQIPVLIDTLEDKEFFVAVTAHKALIAITGQDFGFQDGLNRTQIRKVVQKAKDWWRDHVDDRK